MLRTTGMAVNMSDVPRPWVFEHYLQLGTVLNGQDITMKSIFNAKDTNPSMFVYVDRRTNRYMYKDFSADKGGDGTDLVLQMFNLSTRGESAHKIISDYNEEVLSDKVGYAKRQFKVRQKYKVVDHTIRGWTTADAKYWKAYYIGSDILEFFQVKPVAQYILRKEENDKASEVIIKAHRAYGFFKIDGTLYKIYQPNNRDSKYIKVMSHIQGIEQLTYEKEFLVICSGVKDMGALKRIGIRNIEMVAPDSENSLIDNQTMMMLKSKYKGICTLMDNDSAGQKSMKKYEDAYGLPKVELKIELDLAECVKVHGPKNAGLLLTPLLKQALRSTT